MRMTGRPPRECLNKGPAYVNLVNLQPQAWGLRDGVMVAIKGFADDDQTEGRL